MIQSANIILMEKTFFSVNKNITINPKDTTKIKDISYYNGYLYFLTSLVGTHGDDSSINQYGYLYRVDLNGNNLKLVLKEPIMQNYTIDNNILFYYPDDGNYLYKYNLNTYKISKIEIPNRGINDNGVTDYNIMNGWIYYLSPNNGYLYKMKIDGSGNTLLFANGGVNRISLTTNFVYFCIGGIDDDTIYRIDKNGKSATATKINLPLF
jgi:sugar lactone lactonase YvrE